MHLHERLSTQAILKIAARKDINRDLFADPQQEYREAVQFYQHEIDWSNRLILGDSLQVMASLALREGVIGKVQMIYFDPPYGIKYNSNFQPKVCEREVKDQADDDLTREPEMVKAYRDTWHLGVHSYLTYLRDRLRAAKDLLNDTGSIFIQISDENLSLVSLVADEVFGARNKVQIITLKKKSSTKITHSVADYILWYAKDRKLMKVNNLYRDRGVPKDSTKFRHVEFETGERVRVALLSDEEKQKYQDRFIRMDHPITSQKNTGKQAADIMVEGRLARCSPNRQWSFSETEMRRLEQAGRLIATSGSSAAGVAYWGDFNLGAPPNIWDDFHGEANPIYVVQTNWKVLEKCILMTTQPGDLVLDPTCGSGTTAYAAETWGRRWIAIDSSRIAIALTRRRLLTSHFDYFKLRNPEVGVSGGFQYKKLKKISFRDIAHNKDLDAIFVKHADTMEKALLACTKALADVSDEVRTQLKAKLEKKKTSERTSGEKRKWYLPEAREGFEHWTVPFDTDKDWPNSLKKAVSDYRKAWRARMDEIDKCIENNASQEDLLDKPLIDRQPLRVSGPFSVEATLPLEARPEEQGQIEDRDEQAMKARAHIKLIISLLKTDGVRFTNNKQQSFSSLTPTNCGSDVIHAEGEWGPSKMHKAKEGNKSVAVVCGPQYGSVSALQVEQAILAADERKYDDLVIAGFNFDGAAQAAIKDHVNSRVRIHKAHICPDINPGMKGLLSTPRGSQLFTIFGEPRISVNGPDNAGFYIVKLEGVDIYDPVSNEISSCNTGKIVSWALDNDYDGRTFCPSQVFFPSSKAWDGIKKKIGSFVNDEAFKKLMRYQSFPFSAGPNRLIAVKVIDPRGNEVMAMHKLEKEHEQR